MIILLVLLLLPTLLYFSFYIPAVQKYAVKELSKKLSTYFETRITFSKVYFKPFYSLSFKDFCIYAKNNDTILYSPDLTSGLKMFSLSSNTLALRTISLEKPKINFFIDSTRTINFQFIIDKLTSKSSSKTGGSFEFGINHIQIRDGLFYMRAFDRKKEPYGVNFKDIELRNLNIEARNFISKNAITSFRIVNMSAKEKSGFEIIDFAARSIIDKNNLTFNKVKITTNISSVDATQLRLNFKSYKELGANFIENITLFVDINKSSTTSDDIAYFAPKLKEFHFPAEISGKITGKIRNLRGRNLNIKFGTNSSFSGNADIEGLPEIKTSFLYIDIKKFYTTPRDLERINIPGTPTGKLKLPEILHKVNYLNYSGKFSGFLTDFVAYGTITSNLGKISSDLSIRPDTANSFSFKGKIKTYDFNLGYLLNQQKNMGKISLNAMVNGKNSVNNQLSAKMDGEIYSFNLKKYNYKNIKINGTISGKTYDGAMSVSDPNIDLNFLGKVNLSTETPEFNFSVKAQRVNLYKLNLDTTDTASFISFYATADFAGKNIDDLNGEIKLWNSTLKKTNKEIHINDLLLFSKNINEKKRIVLRSDLADAEIWGTYQFLQLPQTFQWFVKHYLPSVILKKTSPEKSTLNNFSFEFFFKDTRLLTDFFVPGLYISRDSKLSGNYNPSASDVNFQFTIPFLNFQGKKFYDIDIDGSSSDQGLSLKTGCSSLKLNNHFSFDNLTISAEASGDSIRIFNRWNNWDSIAYKGNIATLVTFTPSQNQHFPKVNIAMAQSQIVLHDTLWKINPSLFSVDSNKIAVNHLELLYNNQKIVAEGAISRLPNDKLNIKCSNVDLSVVNPFIPGNYVNLAGIVNGEAELLDLYNNPLFHANIKIDSLKMNHETLGKTEIDAKYNNSEKSIDLSLVSLRGSLRTLEANGIYQIQTKKLDGEIHLNKLKVNIFQPFAAELISDLKGLATGDLNVHGTLKEPIFNGEINAQKIGFMVNYLKTRYSFSKPIKVKDNNIYISDVVLYDSRGKCEVNGKITHNYFKNFYFDLKLRAYNFEFLNTTEKDNSLFYGKVYATSDLIEIYGPPKSLTMNINARTEKNSILSIPLGNRSNDISELRFVRFVDKTPKVVTTEYDYEKEQKKKNNVVNLNGLKLNINLEVTPDATAQIIFDSKIGDMIQGNGYGNIRMEINTQGKFGMYGNYTIEDGHYLFTLQNVINKNFKVSQGGTVSWNGNPIDATIDIEAIYPVRASLYDLLAPTMPTVPEEYKSRIPIDCKIYLTGKLMNPEPKFEINLPNSPQTVQTMVNSAISNQDELNKQFISLLVLGSFLPDQNMAKGEGNTTTSSGFNPVGSTGMEFISNQLSRWLSQINQDFDIGVNYRPETGLTSQELEVALSTQLLNDKLSINGNFDVGGTSNTNTNKENTNNIVGDFELDYKPWKSGKVHFKAFRRSNDNIIYSELSPYTEGVGISYKEDFNSFGELMKKYWKGIFAKKEDEIKPKMEKESSQVLEQE